MQTITQNRLKELVNYDPISGVFTWKPRSNVISSWNSRYAGKRAGRVHIDKRGYEKRDIGLDGKRYSEHRLAFLYMTGDIPEFVDHENGIGTDNRWCNLTPSNSLRNNLNKSKRKDNSSGVTGAYLHRGKWRIEVQACGKRIRKGPYEELDEAALEILELRNELGFSKRHGLEIAHYHQQETVNVDHHN